MVGISAEKRAARPMKLKGLSCPRHFRRRTRIAGGICAGRTAAFAAASAVAVVEAQDWYGTTARVASGGSGVPASTWTQRGRRWALRRARSSYLEAEEEKQFRIS